jgi:hypothetical protein
MAYRVILLALLPVFMFGQNVNLDKVNARQSITLRGNRVDSFSIDRTFASPSNNEVATQKAVYDYISGIVSGLAYLPIAGGTLTGTGGAGFIGFPAQSSAPSTPGGGFRIFANGANNLAIRRSDGYITTIDLSTATADRFFTLPANGGTFGILENTQTWTGTNTFTGDANKVTGIWTVERAAVSGVDLIESVSAKRWRFGISNNNGTDKTFTLARLFGGNAEPFQIYENGNFVIQDATGTYNQMVPSAVLNVSSLTKGILFPRPTTAQRDAISSPADLLFVMNSTTKRPNYYNATLGAWVEVPSMVSGGLGVGQIAHGDANGNITGNSSMVATSTTLDISKAINMTSNQSGTNGALRIQSTAAGSLGYASVLLYPSSGGGYGQFFQTNATYPVYNVITANTFGMYTQATGGFGIQLDAVGSSYRVGVVAAEIFRANASGIGIFTSNVARPLTVNGAARISGSAGTPYYLIGRDSAGLGDIANFTKLFYSGTKALNLVDSLNNGVVFNLINKRSGTNAVSALVTYNELNKYVVFGISSSGYNTIASVGGNRGYIYTEANRGFTIQSLIDTSTIMFKVGGGGGREMTLSNVGLGINRKATANMLEVAGDGAFYGKGDGITYIGSYPTTFAGGAPDPSVEKTGFIYNTNSRFAILSGPGFSVQTDIVMHVTKSKKISYRAINDTLAYHNFNGDAFFRDKVFIGATPVHSSSVFDVSSTIKGSRPIPSGTDANIAAVASPALALQMFSTTSERINVKRTDGFYQIAYTQDLRRDSTYKTVNANLDLSGLTTTFKTRFHTVRIKTVVTAAATGNNTITMPVPSADLLGINFKFSVEDTSGDGDISVVSFGTDGADGYLYNGDGTFSSSLNAFPGIGIYMSVAWCESKSAYRWELQ